MLAPVSGRHVTLRRKAAAAAVQYNTAAATVGVRIVTAQPQLGQLRALRTRQATHTALAVNPPRWQCMKENKSTNNFFDTTADVCVPDTFSCTYVHGAELQSSVVRVSDVVFSVPRIGRS